MRNKPYPLYTEGGEIETFDELFCRNSVQFSDQTAITYKDKTELVNKTYAQLYADARKTASFLRTKKLSKTAIAIVGKNSYPWLIAFLGIIFSGNIAVPLNYNMDNAELLEALQQAEVSAVFCDARYEAKIYALAREGLHEEESSLAAATALIPVFRLNELLSDIAAFEPCIPEPVDQVDDPAMIFFTSGTTGRSKGVVLSQHNLCFDVSRMARYCYPPGGFVTIAVLPFYHTYGFLSLLLNFLHGREVFLSKSIKSFVNDLIVQKPILTYVVPAVIEGMYKTIVAEQNTLPKKLGYKARVVFSRVLLLMGIDKRKSLFRKERSAFGGNLEVLGCGGSPSDWRIKSAYRDWGIYIVEGYGITECSPLVAVTRNLYWRDGSAGQVLQDVSVRIAEDGEILVKGDNVFQGYINDEASTIAAFQDGWFCTGDLGYVDHDDFLFITGRKKNLIILPDGENISPEELEHKLHAYFPEIDEVVVYQEGAKIIAEIYVASSVKSQRIRDRLSDFNRTLSTGKRIHEIRLRPDAFPKTGSGKIKRS